MDELARLDGEAMEAVDDGDDADQGGEWVPMFGEDAEVLGVKEGGGGVRHAVACVELVGGEGTKGVVLISFRRLMMHHCC